MAIERAALLDVDRIVLPGGPVDVTQWRATEDARSVVGRWRVASIRPGPLDHDGLAWPFQQAELVDGGALDATLATYGLPPAGDAVGPDEVAWVVARPGTTCAADATVVPIDRDLVTLFANGGRVCDDTAQTWVYVVAIDRALLDQFDVLGLPSNRRDWGGAPGGRRRPRRPAKWPVTPDDRWADQRVVVVSAPTGRSTC